VRDNVGLASALARHIAATSDNPRRDAIAAGEAWGTELALAPRHDASTSHVTVLALLDELGFAPEVDSATGSIALRRCPLLDAVRAAPDIVCAVHLGLARGALAARGASATAVRLTPFAQAGACRLYLA
jgi:predicted ArsR family transcriptional regulator